jgi:outer membrane immunogenic protein
MPRSAILLAAIAAVFSQAALAADLPRKAPAPVVPPAPIYNWSGFYVGLNAGWVGSTSNDISNSATLALAGPLAAGSIPGTVDLGYDGFIGGGQIGYNWQAGTWLYGLEADIQWSNADANTTIGPITRPGFVPITTAYSRSLDWLGTFRGRVGYLVMPQFLFYATGGLAYGRTKLGNAFICPACAPATTTFSDTSDTRAGWTVGGGVEWMFIPRWSLKAEYLYVDLGDISTTIGAFGPPPSLLTSTVHDRLNIVRAGVNYHF